MTTQRVAAGIVFLLLAGCAKETAPQITRDSIAKFLKCKTLIEDRGFVAGEAFEPRQRRRLALEASDEVARECGFASARQKNRLALRMEVAFAEAQEERRSLKYPHGLTPEYRERVLASLRERNARYRLNESVEKKERELDKLHASLLATVTRVRERKVAHSDTLDPSVLLDESTVGWEPDTIDEKVLRAEMLQREREFLVVEAKTQPPLSVEERALVRAHLQMPAAQ